MTDPATFRIDASVDRLKDVRRFACGRPAEEIARALIDAVGAFRGEAEPFDDLTLLVMERRPA